jgi:AcrR family transcriptional regulator
MTREQRRSNMANEILAALEETVRDGRFSELTVEDLASAAGVSRATFYVYFRDKHDIAMAWLHGVSQQLVEGNRWDELPPDVTRDDVRAMIASLVESYAPHASVMSVVYDLALHDRVIRTEIDALITELINTLAKHIRKGQRRGFIDPTLIPNETAAWLTWMAETTQYELNPSLSAAELDRHIDTYTDILWSTLYAPAQAGVAGRSPSPS